MSSWPNWQTTFSATLGMLRIAREKPQDHPDWCYYTFIVSNLGASTQSHNPKIIRSVPFWIQWHFNILAYSSTFLTKWTCFLLHKKIKVWGLRPQFIPGLPSSPSPPTSFPMHTCIHTRFSQVSKVILCFRFQCLRPTPRLHSFVIFVLCSPVFLICEYVQVSPSLKAIR